MEEMLLREDEKDLYIIKKNNRGEELVDDEELISSAKRRTETYTAIPDKELFTSPYSLEVEDYFDDNLTIKEAIAINGDEYEIGCYDGDVIIKYRDIGFLPSASDPAELTFDMNSTIDKVIIFGDRRVYGALYGQTTLPQIKATLKSSNLPVDKELETTHNDNHVNPYEYIKYLLEKIPDFLDDEGNVTDPECLKDVMPWSDAFHEYEHECMCRRNSLYSSMFPEPMVPKPPKKAISLAPDGSGQNTA